jgi:hypothetical protein
MSRSVSQPDDQKLLPGNASAAAADAGDIVVAAVPNRQLSELPKDELANLAIEFGLDPGDYKSRQHLVAAIHDRRQMIASLNREVMLEVLRWGRRPIIANLNQEQLAQEMIRIKSMRFEGLSQPALVTLAQLRGVKISHTDDVPALVRKLKKKEGLFTRLNRKRRAMLGSIVSNMLGESAPVAGEQPYALPATDAPGQPRAESAGSKSSIKDEIEEAGLFGGIAGRIKRSADEYLNQKLDEIESRIDRKLDEIDRRLAEWRDKEIANRIRILKITLWASVIVGAFSLIYSYVKETINPTLPVVQQIHAPASRP